MREVGGVDGDEGPGVQEEEVALLPGAVKTHGDEDPVILGETASRVEDHCQDVRVRSTLTWARQKVHLSHVVILTIENLETIMGI